MEKVILGVEDIKLNILLRTLELNHLNLKKYAKPKPMQTELMNLKARQI